MPEDPTPILVAQVLLSFAGYSAVGWWYVRPWLAAKPLRSALALLLLPLLFRHIGLTLLVTEVVDPTLPLAMARHVAIADVTTGLLAWAALFALRAGWRHALTLTWLCHVVGTTDLLTNLTHGAYLRVAPHLGGAWLGIAFVVPLMLTAHSLSFAFLWQARGRPA
jgi:hypothetical protein